MNLPTVLPTSNPAHFAWKIPLMNGGIEFHPACSRTLDSLAVLVRRDFEQDQPHELGGPIHVQLARLCSVVRVLLRREVPSGAHPAVIGTTFAAPSGETGIEGALSSALDTVQNSHGFFVVAVTDLACPAPTAITACHGGYPIAAEAAVSVLPLASAVANFSQILSKLSRNVPADWMP